MRLDECKNISFFNINHTIACELFTKYDYPWEILPNIGKFIKSYIEINKERLKADSYIFISEDICIHKSVHIPDTASINGPCIIGENTELRNGVFIRGNVVIGNNCVCGNSCEFKNSIIFDEVQIPHFNYIGDSIISYKSHLGAGAVTSNIKSDKTLIKLVFDDIEVNTGLKKIGAFLSDNVEIGCNSVLNPGTIIGEKTNVYPLSMVRGCINKNMIFKNADNIVLKQQ